MPDIETGALAEYYRKRAAEYDAFYADPARQPDLAELRDWLAARARGRRILELAAGTGYWTAVAAPVAATITATDINAETLAIAGGRGLGAHVCLVPADVWNCRTWRTVRSRHGTSLVVASAETGAWPVPGTVRRAAGTAGDAADDRREFGGWVGAPILRRDAAGDTWQRRWLDSGERFEIVKNYPDAAELEERVGAVCEDVRILQLRHFWALEARFRATR